MSPALCVSNEVNLLYLSSKLDHYYTISGFRDPYSVSKSVSLLKVVVDFRKRHYENVSHFNQRNRKL